jgi:hypothetical protein
MIRPIRVDHTNCLQVAIKIHSFIPGFFCQSGSCLQDTYQGFSPTLIDLIIGFLDLIIKTFDNQTQIFRDQNVYSQIKQDRLKSLSKTISQPPTPYPFSYQPPGTVGYLCFLYMNWNSNTVY